MIDEDRSPFGTPADVQRARERLFAALLDWWEKPLETQTGDATVDRGAVADMMRGLLRDADKSLLKVAQQRARQAKLRRKVQA